ncbi:protein of unknown function [Hyphomicrobium sp. MC1]|nr:protein of unknown function [Hyphomicrobium sp. MC1]
MTVAKLSPLLHRSERKPPEAKAVPARDLGVNENAAKRAVFSEAAPNAVTNCDRRMTLTRRRLRQCNAQK